MTDATRANEARRVLVYRGFRQDPHGVDAQRRWPQERRQAFLLRPEADPCSLDLVVLRDEDGGDRVEFAAVVVSEGQSDLSEAWRASEVYEPLPAQPAWELLGYDICDASGTSGLSNCSYAASDAAHLREEWASKLSAAHLFVRLDDARVFKQLTDLRVPEHAPFAVVEIWKRAGG